MHERFSLEDLVALVERALPASTLTQHAGHVRVTCGTIPCDARVVGSDTGRHLLSFAASLGALDLFEDRFPLSKLLACVATTAHVRAVIEQGNVVLETRVSPDDIAPGQLEAAVRWRLAELSTTALAWRRRLGTAPDEVQPRAAGTLHELIASTPIAPQKALLIAAVGFAVAGADGRFSSRETARLGAWLREVPSFRALDLHRVHGAVATLACDTARTLLEARRHLDGRERLLAWALANDMAHAEGFTSSEERRYLTSVASIFELSPDAMEPFIADAQSRAVRTETSNPPPVLHD